MNQNHYYGIDLLRIVCALSVLTLHIFQRLNIPFSLGSNAVKLFFILSGFLAFYSYEKIGNAKEYYKNRIIKILPTYYICLFIMLLTELIYQGSFTLPLNAIFRYIFLIHNLFPSKNWDIYNNFNGLWTMSCFALFYLIVPILNKYINSYRKSLFLTAASLAATPFIIKSIQLSSSFFPTETHIEWFSGMCPYSNLYCFLIGQSLFLSIKENKESEFVFVMLYALLLTGFSHYSYEVVFTTLLLFATKLPLQINSKIEKVINIISSSSFSLYLIHPIFLKLFSFISNRFLFILISFFVSIMASVLLYYFVIKNITKVLKYYDSRF